MPAVTSFNLLSPVSLAQAALLAVVAVVLLLLARLAFGPPLGLSRRPVLWMIRGLILLVLVAILANPVRVDRSPGNRQRADVSYLLDTSASMALGQRSSRFEQAVQMIREVDRLVPAEERPDINLYRFGRQLAAVESLPPDGASPLAPTDLDTRLLSALRQLTGRFAGTPHPSVVLFSDGRSREPAGVQEMARRYRELGVPIHVVPLGELHGGGDVAVVNMVVPARVRKQSQVGATVWVRSYGYDGRRTELRLRATGRPGKPARELAGLPVTLASGIQAFSLTFQSDLEIQRVEASVPPQPNEVSPENNAAAAQIAVDRTKIRVLYIEGAGGPVHRRYLPGGTVQIEGPYSALENALSEDPDIECVPLLALSRFGELSSTPGSARAFPKTRAQLFAYDAIILSDVARSQFSELQLQWIHDWIRQRGAGLCMAGGPNSFAGGGWSDSPLAAMLPVTTSPAEESWAVGTRITLRPEPDAVRHPLWSIVSGARRNGLVLASLPAFPAVDRGLSPKQSAQVLGAGRFGGAGDAFIPALVVGRYGKGRTMAMAVSLNSRWSPEFALHWGENDNRYYAKFWRNAVYWLTENSYLGRRRLVVASDKMSYRPGEKIQLTARAFDETAAPTAEYRVTAMIEPQSFDVDLRSDSAPVRWPDGVERPSGESLPCVIWGEELDMLAAPDEPAYRLELPLADRLAGDARAEAFRVELSAYQHDILIDSTSIDLQVLDDPFEHRNPLPNPELLKRVAGLSGGRVFSEAESLAAMLRQLPVEVGPDQLRRTPLWSRWWLLGLLLLLLTAEWAWRRNLGLA